MDFLFFIFFSCSGHELIPKVLNNNDFHAVHQNREKNTRQPLLIFFIFSLHPPPPAPRTKAHISNAWAHRHALWRDPASTNNVFNKIWRRGVQSHAKRTWHGGGEEGKRERDVQLLSESWGKRGRGAHERGERLRGNCWEEYCNFQIITLPLWLQSGGGRLVAHTGLACVCVWVSAHVCFLGWRVVWFNPSWLVLPSINRFDSTWVKWNIRV